MTDPLVKEEYIHGCIHFVPHKTALRASRVGSQGNALSCPGYREPIESEGGLQHFPLKESLEEESYERFCERRKRQQIGLGGFTRFFLLVDKRVELGRESVEVDVSFSMSSCLRGATLRRFLTLDTMSSCEIGLTGTCSCDRSIEAVGLGRVSSPLSSFRPRRLLGVGIVDTPQIEPQ